MTDKLDGDNAERANLGKRLKETRKYLGYTQDDVASHLGIPRTALSEIENGARRVEAVELKKMAKLYSQPVSYFIGDEIGTSDLPVDVVHLAREAKGLSGADRAELVQFASFLKARAKQGE